MRQRSQKPPGVIHIALCAVASPSNMICASELGMY